jgi:hypothetical protein
MVACRGGRVNAAGGPADARPGGRGPEPEPDPEPDPDPDPDPDPRLAWVPLAWVPLAWPEGGFSGGLGLPIMGPMPANLTPQYKEAEERFRDAATREEKLVALREMMALLPKHKGTEKLQADIRRRMAKLEEEA